MELLIVVSLYPVTQYVIFLCQAVYLALQEKHKVNGKVTDSPRAMAKFHKEALRVKKVLSANSDIYAQVCNAFTSVLQLKNQGAIQ